MSWETEGRLKANTDRNKPQISAERRRIKNPAASRGVFRTAQADDPSEAFDIRYPDL